MPIIAQPAPLISLAQAKRHLTIAADSTSYDDEVQLWIDATVTAVEKARGQIVQQRSFTDEGDFGTGTTSFVLTNVPVLAITAVATVDNAQTWDPAALHVAPDSGVVTVLSGPPLRGLATVSYTAGMATIPANYTAAGLIILQHLWMTRRGAGAVPRGGEDEMYVPALGYAVPRRAVELLGLSLPGVA